MLRKRVNASRDFVVVLFCKALCYFSANSLSKLTFGVVSLLHSMFVLRLYELAHLAILHVQVMSKKI